MLLVLVEERLDPLVLLEVGQLGRVRELEESRGQLHQPLGVDGRTSVHVLFGGLEKRERKVLVQNIICMWSASLKIHKKSPCDFNFV